MTGVALGRIAFAESAKRRSAPERHSHGGSGLGGPALRFIQRELHPLITQGSLECGNSLDSDRGRCTDDGGPACRVTACLPHHGRPDRAHPRRHTAALPAPRLTVPIVPLRGGVALFGPFAPIGRRGAELALERATKCSLRIIANRKGYLRHTTTPFTQVLRRDVHPPHREILHRRLADL